MALSQNIVWECRASGASDNNGGGYRAGATGIDRSVQNAAQVAIDNSAITTSITTNVITFTAGYTPSANDIGNVVQMLTGTNVTVGFYEITAQTGSTWTVDRNVVTSGTTTNATGNMGGALATLAKLNSAMVASNKAFCTGSFSVGAQVTFAQATATTPNGANPASRLTGYGTTRGDGGMANLSLTATGLSALRSTGQGWIFENWNIDCANQGTSTGLSFGGAYTECINCKVANFTTQGIALCNGGVYNGAINCEVTGGGSAATAAINVVTGATPIAMVRNCWIHDNQCTGINSASSAIVMIYSSIIANNSGSSSDGIRCQQYATWILHNIIHNCGRHGINLTTAINIMGEIHGNIFSSNSAATTAAIMNGSTAVPASIEYDGNAYYGNAQNRNGMDATTTIFGVAPYTNVFDVFLTALPYVGPTTGANANFNLNNTSGGGRDCRIAAPPRTWLGNSSATVNYADFGPAQAQPGHWLNPSLEGM
jgi:hypothetical protein